MRHKYRRNHHQRPKTPNKDDTGHTPHVNAKTRHRDKTKGRDYGEGSAKQATAGRIPCSPPLETIKKRWVQLFFCSEIADQGLLQNTKAVTYTR